MPCWTSAPRRKRLDVDDDGRGTIQYKQRLKLLTHKTLCRFFEDDLTGKIASKSFKRMAKGGFFRK